MITRLIISGTVAVIVALAASDSVAGILTTTAHAHDDGTTLWQGSRDMDPDTNPDVSGFGVDADIDFAVFAPDGSFQSFLTENGITNAYNDPTGGNFFVYAYQIFDDPDTDGGVQSMSLGLDADENPPFGGSFVVPLSAFTVDTPGVEGTGLPFAPDPPTQAQWSFPFPDTVSAEASTILFFASPFGPQADRGTLVADGFGAATLGPADSIGPPPPEGDAWLPSPTPEPATMALLGLGALALLPRRGTRKT